jgi:hypothetical protein
MLEKLFITAAAAAAVSVPLAGVAWAVPSSNAGSHENPVGAGGVPKKAGAFFDAASAANPAAPTANPNGTGNPVTLGNVLKTIQKMPGTSTPAAVGTFTNTFNKTYFGVTRRIPVNVATERVAH